MKNTIVYIIVGVAFVVIGAMFLKSCQYEKRVSTFISLNKADKNPYGTYVLYNGLKNFFSAAKVKVNTKPPAGNKLLFNDDSSKLLIIVVPTFAPKIYEMETLMHFINEGNSVFISCFDVDEGVNDMLQSRTGAYNYFNYPIGDVGPFNMSATLKGNNGAPFGLYSYAGTAIEGYFHEVDSARTMALGHGTRQRTNFIKLKKDKGQLLLHLSPLALSNYFLLTRNNEEYFEKIFSRFPATTKAVIWDEYFTHGAEDRKEKNSWLSSILKYPSLRAGIITAIILLLVYALIEMRRKQRYIPVLEKPKNESYDFVKTVGLLYYDKRDNLNLAQKMSTYFLEQVRSHYKIFAKNFDDGFVREVSDKSGADENLIKDIVAFMKQAENGSSFSDAALILFKQKIESFYNR